MTEQGGGQSKVGDRARWVTARWGQRGGGQSKVGDRARWVTGQGG